MQKVKIPYLFSFTLALTIGAFSLFSANAASAQGKSRGLKNFKIVGVSIDSRRGYSTAIVENSVTREQAIFNEGESLGGGFQISKIMASEVIVQGPGIAPMRFPVVDGTPPIDTQQIGAVLKASAPYVKPNRVVEFETLMRGLEHPERFIQGIDESDSAAALTVKTSNNDDSLPAIFGLLPGDRITAVNTIQVKTLEDVMNSITQVRGDYLTVVFKRGEMLRRVILKPSEAEQEA